MELPDFVPGDDVVGADVAGRRDERFAGRRPQDDEVLPDLAGAVGLDASSLLRSRETDAQIDRAVFTERQDRLAGRGVNRLQVAVDREQQPLVLAVGALPVVDAARHDAAEPLVDPQLLAGRGIERDQRVVPPEHVHDVVDDDRVEPRCRIGVGPCDFELPDVRFLDLVEVHEVGAVGTGEVVPPVAGAARRAGEAGQRGGDQTCRDERERPVAERRTDFTHMCCENIRQARAEFRTPC